PRICWKPARISKPSFHSHCRLPTANRPPAPSTRPVVAVSPSKAACKRESERITADTPGWNAGGEERPCTIILAESAGLAADQFFKVVLAQDGDAELTCLLQLTAGFLARDDVISLL